MTSTPCHHNEHTVLVVYASASGSTAEIAEFLAEQLRARGLHVRTAMAADAPDAALFEVAVLGSAVHNGELLPELNTYIERNREALRHRPVWLFSVGMGPAMRGPIGRRLKRMVPPQIARVRDDVAALEYRPLAGVYHAPTSLRMRLLLRLIGTPYGDLREWDAVSAWAETIAAGVDIALEPAHLPARTTNSDLGTRLDIETYRRFADLFGKPSRT
ncbi:MAG: flavodoxin [Mycobacteriaceae bacterium]|nr:flavodoxin [Mycobacteriaceae bacterium]